MSYSALGLVAVLVALAIDSALLRTRLVKRRIFWVSYAIIFFFQLITNAMFTGLGIVKYDGDAILGETSPAQGPPPFVGGGRLAFAPIEDLLFGYSLVLLTLSLWVFWGSRGVERGTKAGPPRW